MDAVSFYQVTFWDLLGDMKKNPMTFSETSPAQEEQTSKSLSVVSSGNLSIDLDSYLHKSEVLESLSKEYFESEIRKITLSEIEEKLYSLKLGSDDTLLSIVRKISKGITRPLLRSMEHADDAYAQKLLALIDNSFGVALRVAEKDEVSTRYVTNKFKASDKLLILEINEAGYEKLSIVGTKNDTPPVNMKNVLYKNGIAVGDLGEIFAFLIVLSKVKSAYKHIKQLSLEERSTDIVYNKFLALQEIMCMKYDDAAPKTTSGLMPSDVGYCDDAKCAAVRPLPLVFEYVKQKYVVVYHFSNHVTAKKNAEATKDFIYLNRTESRKYYTKVFMDILDYDYHDFLGTTGNSYFPNLDALCLKKNYSVNGTIFELLSLQYLALHEQGAQQAKTLSYWKTLSRTYAKSYQQKKNIPKDTLQAMVDSQFNRYFGYVEFDASCDLDKVEEIAREFIAVKQRFLDFADSSKNAIRFRLLGNHKATGLYYPHVKCLCVDVRCPSSLIHEYGHLIDYEYGNLSHKFDFMQVRDYYKSYLEELAHNNNAISDQLNGNTKYNLSYYMEPTEIFARSFELYMAVILNIKNSLLPAEFSFAYPLDKEFLAIIESYFNDLFSELSKEKYNIKP